MTTNLLAASAAEVAGLGPPQHCCCFGGAFPSTAGHCRRIQGPGAGTRQPQSAEKPPEGRHAVVAGTGMPPAARRKNTEAITREEVRQFLAGLDNRSIGHLLLRESRLPRNMVPETETTMGHSFFQMETC